MATEEEIRDLIMQFPVGHPLRRVMSGPSDIEWALLSQKVGNMEAALSELTKEVKLFNDLAMKKCENCSNSKSIADHERRLRELEQMMWKATGIAAIGSGLLTFVMSKLVK